MDENEGHKATKRLRQLRLGSFLSPIEEPPLLRMAASGRRRACCQPKQPIKQRQMGAERYIQKAQNLVFRCRSTKRSHDPMRLCTF
eukprot:1162067-Pelagomonas_calceolata.AAC.1